MKQLETYFQNSVNGLSKMVLKSPDFCQKVQDFVQFGPCNFVQIYQYVVQILIK